MFRQFCRRHANYCLRNGPKYFSLSWISKRCIPCRRIQVSACTLSHFEGLFQSSFVVNQVSARISFRRLCGDRSTGIAASCVSCASCSRPRSMFVGFNRTGANFRNINSKIFKAAYGAVYGTGTAQVADVFSSRSFLMAYDMSWREDRPYVPLIARRLKHSLQKNPHWHISGKLSW